MRCLSAQRQQGFTLVEVMVTVFVVAIGLLAAAALQVASKKAAMDAVQRTTATVVAQEMIERIRANALLMSQYNVGEISSAPAQPACGSTSDCSNTDLVAYDLYTWWQNLEGVSEKISTGSNATESAGGLRNPKACLSVTGNQVVVVVVWRGLSMITQGAVSGDSEDPTGDPCFATNADFFDPPNISGSSYRRVLRIRANV